MKTKAKAKKAAKLNRTDASVAYRIRQAVVRKPDISFEAAARAAGIEPVVGKHGHNVWQHAHHVLQMFATQYGNR